MSGKTDYILQRISKSDHTISRKSSEEQTRHKHKDKKSFHPKSKEELKYHLQELQEAVERAHIHLKKHNLPYRFSLNIQNDQIFIDLIIMNKNNFENTEIKRNITHDEFWDILNHLESHEGIILDIEG